ncbi:TM2 domain-containing membrane protein YozV [Aneurinibacillus soli]|uniref:TM2 domain protein n=1 Tax=Aneurinibacillus soli TaxID=1500254 RepID=A0A0U5C428_9BACL|nr:TM2 domain-containing protein [Aneurinibacillus soli]PYE60092.1 TM2 domain-containing membrane protein YozV [Aneurinibacillus soli]BAU26419.1 TM2 domain protein [Aneurinibacillus soli]
MDNFSARQGLTTEEQLLISGEFDNKKKSKTLAYLLWLFLGCWGAHRFYTGDVGLGVGMIVVWIISFFLLFIPIIIWVIVDVFLIGKRVDELNNQIEAQIIAKVRATK